MDYYEEFGLDRNATPDEIRQAYKRLVRLLHPDRCRDDALRRLADLQMKRLNGILQTLTNPLQRAAYDLMLVEHPHPQQPRFPRPQRPPLWFCISAVCLVLMGAVLLVWLPKPGLPAIPAREPPEEEAAEPPAPASAPSDSFAPGILRARASPRIPENSPAESPPFAAALPDPAPEPAAPPAFNTGGVTIKPASSHLAEPARVETRRGDDAPPATPGWSGDWLYVHEQRTLGAGLYAPEYIELRITEDGAGLHGRYRARYHVPDRAISPAVAFHFDGMPNSEGVLPWNGAGGAHGEVKLRLLPGGALEVSWAADQLGDELGLISGTASLIRKLD